MLFLFGGKTPDVIHIAKPTDNDSRTDDGPLRLPVIGSDSNSKQLLERPWHLSIDVIDYDDRRCLVTDSITKHIKPDARLIDLLYRGVVEKQYASRADRDLGFRLLYWHDALVPEFGEYHLDLKLDGHWHEFYGVNHPAELERCTTHPAYMPQPISGQLTDYLDITQNEIMIPMRIDIGEKGYLGGIWESPYRS